MNILALIMLLIGVAIYKVNPKYVIFYWMLWRPIVFPLICFSFHIVDVETQGIILHNFSLTNVFLFLLLIIKELLNNNKIILPSNIIAGFGLLMCYLLIGYRFNITILSSIFIVIFSLVFPFLYIYICKTNCLPSLKELLIFSFVLIVFELLMCIANLYGIGKINNLDLVSGSFRRFNDLGNYMTTLFLLISISFFKYKVLSLRNYLILFPCILFMLILSGAKISFALFGFIILSSLFFYKKNTVTIVVLTVLLYVIYKLYTVIDINSITGLQRIINIQERIQDSEFITTDLSFYLLENYFSFFGNWNAGNEFAYQYLRFTAKYFFADARLMYTLAENGLFGLSLYLYLFYQIIYLCTKNRIVEKKYNVDNKTVLIIFLYYFLLTITEPGFFDDLLYPLILVFIRCKKTEQYIFT